MAASAGIRMEKLQSSRHGAGFARNSTLPRCGAVQISLTGVIDTLSIEAFDGTLRSAFPKGIGMLAVGGIGRASFSVFRHRHHDLAENESLTATIKDSLSEFMRLVVGCGLRLSHSVRTVNDCAEVHDHNPELNISLLDRRLLAATRRCSQARSAHAAVITSRVTV